MDIFEFKKSEWLVVAPHQRFPSVNGADISIEKYSIYLSKNVRSVDLLSEMYFIRYEDGRITYKRRFANRYRSKFVASLLSLLTFSHYSRNKFITRSYKEEFSKVISEREYDVFLYSYIFTLDTFFKSSPAAALKLVWTHNDDIKWFSNAVNNAKSIPVKFLNSIALNKSKQILKKQWPNTFFLAVSDMDMLGLKRLYPELKLLRVKIGCDVLSDPIVKKANDFSITLSFIGSLNVTMNIDAIKNFESRFFPKLNKAFNEQFNINIIGSNPTELVKEICQKNNWKLYPNCTDEEIREILIDTDFTILPFAYSVGIKLKLLFSLSNSIPVLSTETTNSTDISIPQTSLFSNNPEDWILHIQKYRYISSDFEEKQLILKSVAMNAWEIVVRDFINELPNHIKL